jgi:hypothetical protein
VIDGVLEVNELAISLVVYVCVMGGALIGMYLNRVLPPEHVKDHTRQAVNIAIGVIATLAALVLGLMVASAKSSFDSRADDMREIAAHIIIVDQLLREYGPATTDARDQLRKIIEARLNRLWAEELQTAGAPRLTELESVFRGKLLALSPANDAQKWLQARALSVAGDLEQTRWLLLERSRKTIPTTFLVVLVSWLVVIFGTLGLFSPRNGTAYAIIFICALSVATAIFLVLELDQPFEGVLKVSDLPVRNALGVIGR